MKVFKAAVLVFLCSSLTALAEPASDASIKELLEVTGGKKH